MSTHIEPRPRPVPSEWAKLNLVYGRTIPLPTATRRDGPSFEEVLDGRRSSRKLVRERFRSTAAVLTEAMGARRIATDRGSPRYLSPTLSAGALHSVEAVLVRGQRYPVALYYDALDNSLKQLVGIDGSRLRECLESCREVLPDAAGDFLFLLAMASKASAFYSDPESLLWRDAGAQLQVLAMVAEARGLGFCPLGIVGAGIVEALKLPSEQMIPVGVAAVGARRR